MPYPFHHALAFSSDVDWSTEEQVEQAHQRLNGELGLPVSGSFFLTRASEEWVSAVSSRTLEGQEAFCRPRVAAWFYRGILDTLHAWINNVEIVPLRVEHDGTWD